MSFLSRLFKTKEPQTLEQQIAALDQQTPEQLLSVVQQENQEALRVAAVSRLPYSSNLLEFATNVESGQIQTAARKRIGTLLDAGDLQINTISQSITDQATLLMLCGYSSHASVALVEQLNDPQLLLDIAQNGTTTSLRQGAALKIEEFSTLELLAKTAKTKDKSVYKIVKSKLDVFKEEKAEEARLIEEAHAVCAQAEQLAKRNVDDIFHARKKQIGEAWARLSEPARNAAQARYDAALAQCQSKLDAIVAELKEQYEQAEIERQAKRHVQAGLVALQQFLAKAFTTRAPEDEQKSLEQLQEQQEQAVREAKQQGLNVEKENTFGKQLVASAQQLLATIKEHGALDQLQETLKTAKQEQGQAAKKSMQQLLSAAKHIKDIPHPEIVKSSKATLKEWDEAMRDRAEKTRKLLRECSGLLGKGDWAVTKGYVGRSRAILRDLEERIAQLDELPQHLKNKLEALKESIERLGDWHEFAVTPKKEALIKEMEAMIDSDLHPADLSDKINKLQASWKELSRGGQQQDEHLWEAFQAAAQQAYAPCKIYFEEQAQARDDNAVKRRALLSQLNEYDQGYDWENAVWKDVDQTLKLAREAWQSYWPIPRKQIKPLQQEFDEILDKLYGRLHEDYEKNRQKKEALVEQASKLLDAQDTPAAIETAKQLQATWQTIGRCKRKDDQALWKAFRGHCDSIFEKRHQETAALQEERQQAKQQAEAILQELEQIASTSGPAFFDAKTNLDDINQRFQGVGELPREHSKGIAQRYQKLLEQIQKKTDDERKEAAAHLWIDILQAADNLRLYEQATIQHSDSATALRKNIENRLQSAEKWPAGCRDELEKRLQQAGQATDANTPENIRQLRLLCIRSEILVGLDTPEEDRALRMEYQVEQLQQGLGRIESLTDATMGDFIDQWVSIAAVPDTPYYGLLERFKRCWKLPL